MGGKVIVFDRKSGMGVVYHQFRRLLRFREFIDWTYAVNISPCRQSLHAIVAGYKENQILAYDIFRRSVKTAGRKCLN